jgi:predicted GNAT family N-acyltransferase
VTFLSEALKNSHNKKAFSCGKRMLDNYLHHQAGQDIKRKLSTCFVLADKGNNIIKGYYTLSNSNIQLDFVPENIKRKLPKSYTALPAILMGRLAVDSRYPGQGTGKMLLIDALKRSFEISKSIGYFAVVVDPLDNEAKAFYFKYGFILLPDSGKMFLSMKTIEQLFKK